jgi:ribosomal protein L37E
MSAYQPSAGPPPDESEPGVCAQCGVDGVPALRSLCSACLYEDQFPDRDEDDANEPIGSCDECGTNLYADDDWDGLCNQCAWPPFQQ